MDFPTQINTIRMGLSIKYFKGSHIGLSKLLCIIMMSLKIVLNSAKCVDPDEMKLYGSSLFAISTCLRVSRIQRAINQELK